MLDNLNVEAFRFDDRSHRSRHESYRSPYGNRRRITETSLRDVRCDLSRLDAVIAKVAAIRRKLRRDFGLI